MFSIITLVNIDELTYINFFFISLRLSGIIFSVFSREFKRASVLSILSDSPVKYVSLNVFLVRIIHL